MSDKNRGIYDKFKVTRRDGGHRKGRKHSGCQYFVLDLSHDPHAVPALRAYAKSCAKNHPRLAEDILDALDRDPHEFEH
jgi:hypothetical protein